MIDDRYFDLNHGHRETAPDGLINKSDLLEDIHTFIDLFRGMEPYKVRKPAFAAAKIVEFAMARLSIDPLNQDPVIALVTLLMIVIRERVDNKPGSTVQQHLDEIYNADVLEVLRRDLSSVPYRETQITPSGSPTLQEDYSVVRALGDRFPIEFASSLEPEDDDQAEESDGSEFQFEIIDESDLEPESDEEDDQ